jgi:hypothetical protein
MRAIRPLAILLVLLAPALSTADDGSGKDLSEPGPRWKRLKAAETLVTGGDVENLYQALVVLAKRGDADDIELVASLALDEDNPLVRLLYGFALEKAGSEKAAPVLAGKLKEANADQKTRGIEVLGLLREPSTVDALLEHTASPDRMVATEAFRALARIFPRKEIERLAQAAVASPDEDARRRGAWAVADVLKSPKSAQSAFGRLARGKGPQVDLAKALISDLGEQGLDEVFVYPKGSLLAGVEPWVQKRKPEVALDGDALSRVNLKKCVEFLREKSPSYYQLVSRAFNTISGKGGQDPIVWVSRTFVLQPGVASDWHPEELATLLVRGATQMLLRDCGDNHWMRRGFEEAAKNTYWYIQNHSGFKVDDTLPAYIDGTLRRKLWR